eukprot:c22727_g1_i1 orf=304-2277(-)
MRVMASWVFCLYFLLQLEFLIVVWAQSQYHQTLSVNVDVTDEGRPIPTNLFGISFEEINHAGAGGLWAELVENRGFEAGGQNTPSNISPWSVIGDERQVRLETDLSSCFELNPVALKMEILCDSCPPGGVGVYNPGFWGMDIVTGEKYMVTFWIRSTDSINISVAFTSSDRLMTLAQKFLVIDSAGCQYWTKQKFVLTASKTDHYGSLSLTSTVKGTIWLDQVSAMPLETYKGHGFRKDLALMLEDLKPRFIRFPGGSYVEGQQLRNSFQWRQSIGPWEGRPGHFGDVWEYWTDDGLGFYEFLQLAEDLNASPVWVFNSGMSSAEEVPSSVLGPFVKDILNALEFARGLPISRWGSVRTLMGHPEPFELTYLAIGNQDCGKQYYLSSYMKFYAAIKKAYPDIYLISNCDGSLNPLDHPADMYDIHIYTSASSMFSMAHQFDHANRGGPKAFVSEYQVHGNDAGNGNLLAALAEGAFLIGVEQNSDVVNMASYAPLFVNANNRRFTPDAIVFNSWQHYGTPSYWVQHFFKDSSGATLLPIDTKGENISSLFVVSALKTHDRSTYSDWLVVKAVNFGKDLLRLQILVDNLPSDATISHSTMTLMTSGNLRDENSFSQTRKVVPMTSKIFHTGNMIDSVLPAYSICSIKAQLAIPLHDKM